MKEQRESTYGAPKMIRYLVNSVDDLREITDTVRFIVSQNCESDDYDTLVKMITVTAIPMGNGVSSFILGFNVPGDILERSGSEKRKATKGKTNHKSIAMPKLSYSGTWSQFGFDIRNLDDLIGAVHSTVSLFQEEAKNLDYINLKRSTKMKVKNAGCESETLKIQFSVPTILGQGKV